MPFNIVFSGTVAKHVEAPGDNEDVYRVDEALGRIVLCDGASESFDAKSWAGLVADWLFLEDLTVDGLNACVQAYSQLHDPRLLSWSKAAAYQRGSFATALVAQDDPLNLQVRIRLLGDSLAVWSDRGGVSASLPYSRAEEFGRKPMLLSSRPDANIDVARVDSDHWNILNWSYADGGSRTLLCMTDALGEWLLRHEEVGDSSAFEQLSAICDQHQLVNLVQSARADRTMRRDDCTLVTAVVSR